MVTTQNRTDMSGLGAGGGTGGGIGGGSGDETGARPGTAAALAAFALFVMIMIGSYLAWQRAGGPAIAGAQDGPWRVAPGVRVIGPGGDVKDDGRKIEMATVLHEERHASKAADFKSAEVVAVMGHSVLDLSEAQLNASGGVIEAIVICGRADIKVPPDWTVKARDTLAVGALRNQARDGSADPAKMVRLDAVILLGAVDVTH